MGVIFRREVPEEMVSQTIAKKIEEPIYKALLEMPSDDDAHMRGLAVQLAGQAAEGAAPSLTQPPAKITIAWVPFFIAVVLFFLLLGITILLDWQNLVHDPKVYSGLASTALGAVIGFLGGDATGTGSSQ